MTEVRVVGVGMTRFGKFPDLSPKAMAAEVVAAALADAGMAPERIGAVYVSNVFAASLTGQESVRGQVWLDDTALAGVPVFNVENACASGSTAVALGRIAIAAGEVENVLVLGLERMTHPEKGRALRAMEGAMDQERLPELRRSLGLEEGQGSPFMQVYAEYARAYMERSGATQEDFASAASKNHAHGALNPRAQFRDRFSVEEILAARPVTGPLTVPMCAPIGDGAAAAVLTGATSKDAMARSVRLLSSVVGSGVRGRSEQVVTDTARRAFERAGIEPADIDVLEVHDAASPAEFIVLEELGIVAPGDAPGMIRAGETTIGGRLPVNPSGGLVSKGHPLGATGLAQVFELVEQLRGEAGDRQVEGARIAVAENAGGYLGPEPAAAAVTVLAR
ncbi:thiolase family protein [Nocardioides sp. AE5]|uniref:thiolase family protein n=1 Tax=Nocardioides sp. AE5 TaxID=2962573 RepID=UPI0028821865|nr:thiolase family protein [Nocardioides sp. AE5]MDT0200911.1 thiolase family protein [Nocardioides sp. AE5]